jgi:hypothetical protein
MTAFDNVAAVISVDPSINLMAESAEPLNLFANIFKYL